MSYDMNTPRGELLDRIETLEQRVSNYQKRLNAHPTPDWQKMREELAAAISKEYSSANPYYRQADAALVIFKRAWEGK